MRAPIPTAQPRQQCPAPMKAAHNRAPPSDLPTCQALQRRRIACAQLTEEIHGGARHRGDRPWQSGQTRRAGTDNREMLNGQALSLPKNERLEKIELRP